MVAAGLAESFPVPYLGDSWCDPAWELAVKQRAVKLAEADADGSWARRCLNRTALGTSYAHGVLTVPPASAEKRRRLRNSPEDLRSGVYYDEVVWVHDLSRCRNWQSCASSLVRSAGQRVVRRWSPEPWEIQLNWTAMAVVSRGVSEVHAGPKPSSALADDQTTNARSSPREAARGRPSIYVLVLDSVSRASLASSLPKTRSFLEHLRRRGGRHRSFPFKKYHTVQYGGTIENHFGLWYGGLLVPPRGEGADSCTLHGHDSTSSMTIETAFAKRFTNRSRRLFANFKDAGYTTSWSGSVQPGHHFVEEIDHLMPFLPQALVCDSQNVGSCDWGQQDSACLGHLPLGVHILEYNEKVLQRTDGDAPRFLWSQPAIGHVGLGGSNALDSLHRLQAYDELLVNHLGRMLSADPSTIVYVMSDHGLKYPACDNKHPFLYIIFPEAWLQEQPPSLERVLVDNGDHVVTAWDVYATLRHLLAKLQSEAAGHARNADADDYYKLKHVRDEGLDLCIPPRRGGTTFAAVDLTVFRPSSLMLPIGPARSCSQLGIAPSNCGEEWTNGIVCAVYEELSPESQPLVLGSSTLGSGQATECQMFGHLVDVAIAYLNMQIESQWLQESKAHAEAVDNPCLTVSAGSLEMAYWNDQTNACLVRFTTKEGKPPRVFEAHFDGAGSTWPQGLGFAALDQVTLYRQYEVCAPRGMASICICREDS
eukprot:TRINITY_DN17686_c0_g2_i2.p1 TRINITY_DN17686_c0_g2~~TRINITY_DN17686_c0_g2_i2.p1  ORF type:complete len:708 (+),score=117.88 TRINITY_DN17686_c0_g2_i2:155-2278(+)